MRTLALVLIGVPVSLAAYAYVGYPILLLALAALRPRSRRFGDPSEWPVISVLLPAYNEARSIRATLESLVQLDYPPERRQILVVSDASSDGTDDIVRRFADGGVELLSLPRRGGK